MEGCDSKGHARIGAAARFDTGFALSFDKLRMQLSVLYCPARGRASWTRKYY